MQNIKDLIRAFYAEALTVREGGSPVPTMERLLADDFQSINAAETKGKAQLIGQVQGFWKLIPDLKWEPVQLVQEGNTVVVRSVVTGSPKGPFMGLELDGTKSFRITTIDMHTFENGQVKFVNHVEEWLTAVKQLKS
jgi:predicted ester cyclase